MKFGCTFIYVSNVDASLTFLEQAFGLQRRFLHESGTYGELDAGATELAKPQLRPWGQSVSYVRCPDGVLVELCTPIGP